MKLMLVAADVFGSDTDCKLAQVSNMKLMSVTAAVFGKDTDCKL